MTHGKHGHYNHDTEEKKRKLTEEHDELGKKEHKQYNSEYNNHIKSPSLIGAYHNDYTIFVSA